MGPRGGEWGRALGFKFTPRQGHKDSSGRVGPSRAQYGRVGPVRAEWGWGGVDSD